MLDSDNNSTLYNQLTHDFVSSFYNSIYEDPDTLAKFFAPDATVDHLFIDPLHDKYCTRNLISLKLSHIYKPGLTVTFRKILWQLSPIVSSIIVTVTGLFKYNGASWPFFHVFYLTSTFSTPKFLISNAIFYDCVNPKQFLGENFTFPIAITIPSPTITPLNVTHQHSSKSHSHSSSISHDKFPQQSPPPPPPLPPTNVIPSNQFNGINKTSTFSSSRPVSISVRTLSENIPPIHHNGGNNSYTYPQQISNGCSNSNKEKASPTILDDSDQKSSLELNLGKQDSDQPFESSTEYSLDANTIFVGSLFDSTTEEDLLKLFSRFGAIQCVKMIPQKKIAFITFKSSSSVALALRQPEIRLFDRPLRVQQRKIINTVKHVHRENLELYGYCKDDNSHRKLLKHKK